MGASMEQRNIHYEKQLPSNEYVNTQKKGEIQIILCLFVDRVE
jgi:hypothetical protein